MARSDAVTVFVDDAVRGALPAFCARDGVPTADHLVHHQAVGDGARLGVAWLLVFAGPLGWLALAFIVTSRSGRAEMLTVSLPWSVPAVERQQALLRGRRTAGGTVAALVVLVLVGSMNGLVWEFPGPLQRVGIVAVLALTGVLLTAYLVADRRLRRESVDIALDASRRWVSLANVHPDFAAAVRDRQRWADATTPSGRR